MESIYLFHVPVTLHFARKQQKETNDRPAECKHY